jgi:hypothetical protein
MAHQVGPRHVEELVEKFGAVGGAGGQEYTGMRQREAESHERDKSMKGI